MPVSAPTATPIWTRSTRIPRATAGASSSITRPARIAATRRRRASARPATPCMTPPMRAYCFSGLDHLCDVLDVPRRHRRVGACTERSLRAVWRWVGGRTRSSLSDECRSRRGRGHRRCRVRPPRSRAGRHAHLHRLPLSARSNDVVDPSSATGCACAAHRVTPAYSSDRSSCADRRQVRLRRPTTTVRTGVSPATRAGTPSSLPCTTIRWRRRPRRTPSPTVHLRERRAAREQRSPRGVTEYGAAGGHRPHASSNHAGSLRVVGADNEAT